MRNHYLTVKILYFLFALCILCPASWVHAEENVKKIYIEDTSPAISTPKYSPSMESFHPPLGTYLFSITWGKVQAGKATIDVTRDQDFYTIHVLAKTQNTVNKFYKLRFKGETKLSADKLVPLKATMFQSSSKRAKETEITFHDKGEIESVRHKFKDETKKKTEIRKLKTENFTLDPASAVFIVRSLEWEEGISRQFDIFDGKSRHLVTITCTGQEKKDVLGEKRDTWVLVPKIQNITKGEEPPEVSAIRVYLSTDKAKEILIIEGDVFMGKVITRLESFEPLKAIAAGQVPEKKKVK